MRTMERMAVLIVLVTAGWSQSGGSNVAGSVKAPQGNNGNGANNGNGGNNGNGQGNQKKDVAGARISLHPKARTTAGSWAIPPVEAVADNNGTFAMTGVSPGPYTVCARDWTDELLDPCEWSPNAPAYVVESGKAPGRLDLELVRGATLTIEVDDPDGVVPTPFQTAATGMLRMGVFSADGNFHGMRYVSTDRKKHHYELTIPLDTDLKLWIETIGLQVTSPRGGRVDRVMGILIQASNGRAPVRLEFKAASVQ